MSESTRLQATAVRGALRHDEPMADHVSWRAGGRARTFFQPVDVEDLQAFLRTLPPKEALLFVGLGSNLLVRDGGFAGSVVLLHHAWSGIALDAGASAKVIRRRDSLHGIEIGPATTGRLTFQAGAGVPAPHVARFVARHGGAGAEWMAGVPGTIGGALAMNAGCYGGETWEHVVAVTTIDRAGTIRARSPADYEIGYRHVKPREPREEWFLSAVLAFDHGDEQAAKARIKELLQWRVATQPLAEPNAGSVFRNPPGDHAARLIEASGLKGFQVGGALVSPKHANFIVNRGLATAANIEAVIAFVQESVAGTTGVELVPEVRVVGERA